MQFEVAAVAVAFAPADGNQGKKATKICTNSIYEKK